MKDIKFVSLFETTVGPLEVKTETVPWWLTVITLGLFRKVISRLGGPAYDRHEELNREWAQRFHSRPSTIRHDQKTRVFRTVVYRVRFWHRHMNEYAQAVASIISNHHQIMQLFCRLQEAEKSEDFEQAHKLRKEIRRHEEQENRYWQNFNPFE